MRILSAINLTESESNLWPEAVVAMLRALCFVVAGSGCGSGSGSGSGLIWPQLGLVRVQWATLDAIGIRIVIANRFSEIQFQLQKKSLEKTMLPLGPTWMWKMCDGRLCRYPANSCRTFTCGTTVHLAPFTGYACVSISMNYRLTHRTTDGTGPHVSNTNVSLHKSITRNIFCAFKAQLMARGKGVGYGGSDWKSIWWKTILFWFCTRTTNQLIVNPRPESCQRVACATLPAGHLLLLLPLATLSPWAVRPRHTARSRLIV